MKVQKLIAPNEKLYQCLDSKCKAIISDSYRLKVVTKDSEGREYEFYKCPFCGTKLEKIAGLQKN